MDWKKVAGAIGGAAPLVAGLLTGPAAGVVGVAGILASVFGVEATPDAILSAIEKDPAAAAKLREVESNNKVELQRLTLAAQTEQMRIKAEADNQAEQNVTQRAGSLEGTAADLKLFFLGRVVLFFRASQRTVWGYGVIFIDVMVFSKRWPLVPNSFEEMTLFIANLLVLGFLFGERFLANILPIAAEFLSARRVKP